MKTKFLQSVERYTNEQEGKTGYKAIYSNGLDFQTLFFPIRNGVDAINIPSIINSVQLKADFEAIGAEFKK
jgi:hypothetical protein